MTSLFPINFDAAFRTKDEVGEDLSPPSGLCLTPEGNFLLTDDFNHRIQIYDSQFKLLNSFGEKGKEPGQLQYPKGIAVDGEGNIFVADSWNHRIQKFDSQGNHLQSFGTCGDSKGELNEPYDIIIDPFGTLIVVERYNHRIQFFDGDGNSLGWVGQRGTTHEENLADLFETPANLLARPLFEFPTSIATDSCGNYFITDSGNHRIRKFDNQWQEVLTFGESGEDPGQFQYPLCVSIASNDLLYIADLNNNRIQIFTSFGQYLNTIDHADVPLEAPCLTLVDSTGNLYIGSTFDTKILRYQVSMDTEDVLAEKLATHDPLQAEHVYFFSRVQEKCNNAPKALAALEQALKLSNRSTDTKDIQAAIHLGRLALAGKEITDSSIDLAISLVENQFENCRKEMIETFQTWQTHAQKFDETQIKENQLIQNDPQGLREFNKDLYTNEQNERNSFRETRTAFYSFRKITQQFYDFIDHLVESDIKEAQLKSLADILARQWEASVSFINDYFNQKEKCEESMVQILGSSEKDQLPPFLMKYYNNCRTMDLLVQLQFPLRTHCLVLKTLARKAASNETICTLLRGQTQSPSFSENATRIMLRFHEHWQTLDALELNFLEALDASTPFWESENISTLEASIADFSPVAFDSENLDIEQINRVLLSQASEIKFDKEFLIWGISKYNPSSLANQKNELVAQCLTTLKAQSVFEEKTVELLNQLDDMGRQRRDLDAQLRQLGTEDKATPIGINNNMAVLDFQLNLIRRMIKGIDINENLNLHRLIAGAAIVSILDPSQENSQLFDELASYSKKLNDNIVKISHERKTKNFELLAYREQQNQLESDHEVSGIDASIKVETAITELRVNLDRLELESKRNAKSKNLLSLISNFIELSPSTPETPLKQAFSINKAGLKCGTPLIPLGLTHNNKGDLLVADYENHCIQSFTPEGKYKFHFGTYGNTPQALKYPVDLITDQQQNIYVIDEGNGVIKKFDALGNFLLQFEEGILGHVFSLSIDSKDQIHIADPDNNRIAVFGADGKEISKTYSAEQSKNLTGPCGIFCLKDGGTIIGDRSEALLKHFDSEGKLINQVSKEGLGIDDIYYVTCDPQHGIFASDFWHGQIIHLNNDLEVLDVYRKQGNRTGELGKTGGLSIHKGRLAVANYSGRKVQIFSLPS